MEDKRGTKHSHSPFVEGSPSPSDAKTPPSASYGFPLPPGSPIGDLFTLPLLAGVRAGRASGKAPVIDLSSSSDEEDLITATSCDFEFAQRLFSELNRAVMGSSSDGTIIILSDSDEEEVHEEKTTGTEDAAASTVVNPASTASTSIDDAHVGAKNNNSDDQGHDQESGGDNDSRDNVGEP
jgi:hypothetical protein